MNFPGFHKFVVLKNIYLLVTSLLHTCQFTSLLHTCQFTSLLPASRFITLTKEDFKK